MPTLNEIISHGKDITNHFLDTSCHPLLYKVFRYGKHGEQNVYSISFDEQGTPSSYVHMWASHNKEKEQKSSSEKAEPIDSGLEGEVYAKTSQKAIKKRHGY